MYNIEIRKEDNKIKVISDVGEIIFNQDGPVVIKHLPGRLKDIQEIIDFLKESNILSAYGINPWVKRC